MDWGLGQPCLYKAVIKETFIVKDVLIQKLGVLLEDMNILKKLMIKF
jgi:hypothetical protein